MQIRIGSEDLNSHVPDSERKSLSVETHAKRGDTFNVMKVDTVMCDGGYVTFTVPDGGKLLISTPRAGEEVVYDAAQGASIHKSQQGNDEMRADRPHEAFDHSGDKVAAPPTPTSVFPGSQGQDTRSPAERQASQPNQVPPGAGASRVTLGPNPSVPNPNEGKDTK